MRAALVHSTGVLWLAGDPAVTLREHPGVDGFRVAGNKEIQTDLLVDGEEALHTDRGNLQTTVTFETSRLFSTPAAAQVWSGIYDATQPNTGTLAICAPDADAYALLNFPGAVVLPPRRQVIGCTVLLGYEVLCGLPVEPLRATGTLTLDGVLAADAVYVGTDLFIATNAANPVPPLWDKTAAGLAAAIHAVSAIVTAVDDGDDVILTAEAPGAGGNAITLNTSAPTRIIRSGSTLTGGTGVTP